MDFNFSPSQLALKAAAHEVGLRWRGEYAKWDAEDESPYDEIVASLRDAGLLGLTIPREYGGKGCDALDYAIVVEELIRTSRSWILGEGPFSTTGPGPSMILLSEDDRTRQKYLPSIVSGHIGCAIALTEPTHGSDLTDLETTAVPDGDHFIINGHKRFITGSPHNELYAVFARFDSIPGARGVGCVLVEKGTPGCEVLRGVRWFGCRGLPHGEVLLSIVIHFHVSHRQQGVGRHTPRLQLGGLDELFDGLFHIARMKGELAAQQVHLRGRKTQPLRFIQSLFGLVLCKN